MIGGHKQKTKDLLSLAAKKEGIGYSSYCGLRPNNEN